MGSPKTGIGYVLGALIVLCVAFIPFVSFGVAFGILLLILLLWGVVHLVVVRQRGQLEQEANNQGSDKGDKGPGSN